MYPFCNRPFAVRIGQKYALGIRRLIPTRQAIIEFVNDLFFLFASRIRS